MPLWSKLAIPQWSLAGCPALFERKLGLILETKIRIFRANLGLKLGIL